MNEEYYRKNIKEFERRLEVGCKYNTSEEIYEKIKWNQDRLDALIGGYELTEDYNE